MKTNLLRVAAALSAAVMLMSCNCNEKAPSSVMDNILTRTSIRHYTDEPVTDAEVATMLRAAMAAPTAINLQPWQFIVVRDTAVRARLVSAKVNRMYAEAPCLIVICGDTTSTFKRHDDPADAPAVARPNPNWMIDCSAATENLLLAAHELGLGAVWTACWPYKERYQVVKDVLGIPEEVMPLAVVPVGHPAESPAPKDKWKPEKIHYEKW